jgi:hypothetical protein
MFSNYNNRVTLTNTPILINIVFGYYENYRVAF